MYTSYTHIYIYIHLLSKHEGFRDLVTRLQFPQSAARRLVDVLDGLPVLLAHTGIVLSVAHDVVFWVGVGVGVVLYSEIKRMNEYKTNDSNATHHRCDSDAFP